MLLKYKYRIKQHAENGMFASHEVQSHNGTEWSGWRTVFYYHSLKEAEERIYDLIKYGPEGTVIKEYGEGDV